MSDIKSIPAPLAVSPSTYWDGNDGSWNTFIVKAGTPPQDFRVLPSTAGHELWIPVPDGCDVLSPSNPGYCGYLRGVMPVNGVNSSGFAANESSTWDPIGLYTLDAQEAQLGYGGNGIYGLETVVWGDETTSPCLTKHAVAGIADPDFWLGVFGLNPKPSNFTTFNYPISSFLSNLVNETFIPSLTWAYTAGAAYRNQAPASLTLGGYDVNRFEGPGLSVIMDADDSRPLQLALQKVLGANTLDNTVSLLPTGTYHFIDSTLPHIWLPDDSIEQFVSAFGLTYDNKTDLFLINDTMHERLLNLNPTVTFIFSDDLENQDVQNTLSIVLPYAAFDLQASYPYYQTPTNYFPIRRAANSTQYTIGRTLLQEAYLIADFDRKNFTLAQTSFSGDSIEPHIIAIQQPTLSTQSSATATPKPHSSGMSGLAIAGVILGVVAVLALAAITAWLIILRRRKNRQTPILPMASSSCSSMSGNEDKKSSMSDSTHEAAEGEILELNGVGCSNVAELCAASAKLGEVEGETAKWGKRGVQEVFVPGVEWESGFISEVVGSEVVRFELDGENTNVTAGAGAGAGAGGNEKGMGKGMG